MIPQGALAMFGEGIAQALHIKTGELVGFGVSASWREAHFHFKVGEAERVTARVPFDDLERAHAWQGLADGIIDFVLQRSGPQGARPFVLDESGRRHFHLRAETGKLLSIGKSN